MNRSHFSALALAVALAGAGAMHLRRPAVYDPLVPRWLPGTQRAWTIGSGMAELAVAGAVALPATRRLGASAAAALFVGVFPGNVTMAWRWRHRSARHQSIAYARLPLQYPLIRWAWAVREHA